MSTVSDWTEKRSVFSESDRPQISFSASSSLTFKGDLLVIPFYKPKEKGDKVFFDALKAKIPSGLSSELKAIIADLLDEGDFKADVASKQVMKIVGDPSVKYICLVGLGSDPKGEKAVDMEITSAHRLGRAIGAVVKETKIQSVGIVLPAIANAGLTQLILGLHDSAYNDNR